jgi:hypothetical protein
MISVSPEYEAGILATTRQVRGRVVITWTDPFIDPTITASATYKNRICYPDQVADSNLIMSHKWAHLSDELKPNGTFHPAPNAAQAASGIQMGYFGSDRGDDVHGEWDGNNPSITIEFDPRPVQSFLVVGDDKYNEWPKRFKIECFDEFDVLLHTETVTNNTELKWTGAAAAGLNTVAKMVLTVLQWSVPDRVAKIAEFYTGLNTTYEGDDISTMNILEEREISDGSLPVGNISSNELDLELQNIRQGDLIDPYFYGNTNSYLNNLLIPNRRIVASIGLVLPDGSVEWIPMGTFWSGDWSAPETSPNVSTTARDRMEFLRKAEFTTSEIYTSINLKELAEIVLTDAKSKVLFLADMTWTIDVELEDYVIPIAYFPRQDYFKCLRQIVEACRGQVFMSRADVLTITGPSFAGNP